MKAYYLTLPEAKLRGTLERSGLHREGIDRIVNHVQEVRHRKRIERAYRTQHSKAWRALLTPLRQEWNNANVGAAYAPDDVLRVQAFKTYADVLDSVHMRLTAAAFNHLEPMTPSVFAAQVNERNEQGQAKFRIPNGGSHWADWVKPSERVRVERAFAEWLESGTRKKHAKTKEPFKRVEGDKVFAKNKERLLKAVTKEHETLSRAYEAAMQGLAKREADLAEYGAKRQEGESDLHLRLERRLAKAKKALSILTRWTKDDGALPRTWHGVLKR
jgi:hypothetical protein